jgi:L-fucose mutarotase
MSMLKYGITHPPLLNELAKVGHGSRILLADSNYAFDAYAPPNATRVFLNFAPGLLTMKDVLGGLLTAIPIEEAYSVLTDEGEHPPITLMYRELLPDAIPLERMNRFKFYEMAQTSRTTILIATGETQLYANLLLTVGHIKPGGTPIY